MGLNKLRLSKLWFVWETIFHLGVFSLRLRTPRGRLPQVDLQRFHCICKMHRGSMVAT